MSSSETAETAAVAVAIRETLKGPVLGTLRELVPALRQHADGASAYDHAIENLDLLEECFKVFRAQRPRFRHVLRDPRGLTVSGDAQTLACGRSLDEVVAMIVRTAAKRYFRAHFGKGAPKPTPGAKPPRNEGDELYDALKHHLQFEWQVPLVPDYCQLKPAEAKAMGADILELRDRALLSSALSALRRGVKIETETKPLPSALSGAEQELKLVAVPDDGRPQLQRINLIGNFLTLDGKRLRGASFVEPMSLPEVRAVLPSHNAVTQFTGVLERVGATPAAMMVDQLDLRADQLAVLLLKTHEVIGPEYFFRLFGVSADIKLTQRLIVHAKMAGIATPTQVADIARFVTVAFARMAGTQREAAS